jgi:hypothetical protein
MHVRSFKWIRGAGAAVLVLGLMLTTSGQSVSASHAPGGYFDLDKMPPVESSGKQIADTLSTFASTYPYRFTGGPTELLAAEAIRTEMSSLGYTTALEPLSPNAAAPAAPVGPLRVLTAVKRGTTRPDEWILFVGHYDTIATTIYGAYDNGAGTNMLRFLARELADVKTNRSIMFAWYNAEEEGLLASKRHAEMLKAENRKIEAVFGFDMVGIGYPAKPPADIPATTYCMCLYHGARDKAWADPLLRHVNHAFLQFPNSTTTVPVAGNNVRNSDESSFANQGYRTLRWTGMRTAGNYPAYHAEDDTMETIDRVAGGRSFFEQGSLNTLRSAYYTFLAVDNHAPNPAAVASVDGSTASFDAGGTSDEDGAPGSYTWDFGDGTSGQGATASHTYAATGTYTVTLTVADNLWPAVTRTTSLTVPIP